MATTAFNLMGTPALLFEFDNGWCVNMSIISNERTDAAALPTVIQYGTHIEIVQYVKSVVGAGDHRIKLTDEEFIDFVSEVMRRPRTDDHVAAAAKADDMLNELMKGTNRDD